jgi:hypothetical protein
MMTEESERAKPRKKITGKFFKDLLDSCRGHKADMDEINGMMGSDIKQAVETHGLNRKMFGWCRQLDRMEDDKISMHLDDFEHYLEISGINRRRRNAPSLGDNVTHLNRNAAE